MVQAEPIRTVVACLIVLMSLDVFFCQGKRRGIDRETGKDDLSM